MVVLSPGRESASCSFGLAAAQAVGMAIKTTFGSDKGEARCHAPELNLVLEVVGHERATVVVAERKTACDLSASPKLIPEEWQPPGFGIV